MKLCDKDIISFTKWSSSLLLIAGMASTSANFYPYNMYLHLGGIIGWLLVACAWHDRSLIVMNMAAFLIFLSGIISSLI